MVAFYANEQFPRHVVELLRDFGHDVLTVQEADNRSVSDDKVLAFAKSQKRAVLTLNRKDFIKLHRIDSDHEGILVCSRDDNWRRQADQIHAAVSELQDLTGQLIRINKPGGRATIAPFSRTRSRSADQKAVQDNQHCSKQSSAFCLLPSAFCLLP